MKVWFNLTKSKRLRRRNYGKNKVLTFRVKTYYPMFYTCIIFGYAMSFIFL